MAGAKGRAIGTGSGVSSLGLSTHGSELWCCSEPVSLCHNVGVMPIYPTEGRG